MEAKLSGRGAGRAGHWPIAESLRRALDPPPALNAPDSMFFHLCFFPHLLQSKNQCLMHGPNIGNSGAQVRSNF